MSFNFPYLCYQIEQYFCILHLVLAELHIFPFHRFAYNSSQDFRNFILREFTVVNLYVGFRCIIVIGISEILRTFTVWVHKKNVDREFLNVSPFGRTQWREPSLTFRTVYLAEIFGSKLPPPLQPPARRGPWCITPYHPPLLSNSVRTVGGGERKGFK